MMWEGCPCRVWESRCSVSPDALQIRALLPLKSVDQSFHASDSNRSQFSWPKSVEVTIELRSNGKHLPQEISPRKVTEATTFRLETVAYFSNQNNFIFISVLNLHNFNISPDSFKFQWLPSTHDPDPPPFTTPIHVSTPLNASTESLSQHSDSESVVLLTFIFPESAVMMRSLYRFHLNSLHHPHCSKTINFLNPLKTDIIFACERTTAQNCFASIPRKCPIPLHV